MDPRLAEIIDELLEMVQAHPLDLNWQSSYDDQQELLRDLRDHAERARRGDGSRLPELKFSLLPTGPLNEIAFSSGWGDAHVRLASEFDDLYGGPASLRRERSLLASRDRFTGPDRLHRASRHRDLATQLSSPQVRMVDRAPISGRAQETGHLRRDVLDVQLDGRAHRRWG